MTRKEKQASAEKKRLDLQLRWSARLKELTVSGDWPKASQQLSDEVGSERTLLVVCTSFRGAKDGYPNLTVKKIPKAVLNRCEWGKDDYSLRVENLPAAPPEPGQMELL